MRSSTSSLYDLHPNLSSSTSPTFTWLKGASKLQSPELEPKLSSSSSTYASQQTSLESPNVQSSLIASSLLVEWGDTAESDDEDEDANSRLRSCQSLTSVCVFSLWLEKSTNFGH